MIINNKDKQKLIKSMAIIAFSSVFLLSCGVKGGLYLPTEHIEKSKQNKSNNKINKEDKKIINKKGS